MYSLLTLDEPLLQSMIANAEITSELPFLKDAYSNSTKKSGCGGCNTITFAKPEITNALKLKIVNLSVEKQKWLKSKLLTASLVINYQDGVYIKQKTI